MTQRNMKRLIVCCDGMDILSMVDLLSVPRFELQIMLTKSFLKERGWTRPVVTSTTSYLFPAMSRVFLKPSSH